MLKKSGPLWLVVAGLLLAIEGHAGEKSLGATVSETLLSHANYSPLKDDSFKASPDCKRVAYVATVGPRKIVVVDGTEGEPFDGVEKYSIVFSPDSRRVAYAAHAGGKWYCVVDGKKNEMEGSYSEEYDIVFSPDSQRVAYVASAADGRRFVVVDGKSGKTYGRILGSPVFSPDSRRVAYGAVVDGTIQFVVVDGEEGGKHHCDWVCMGVTIVFSPDSQRVAYSAPTGKKRRMVVDGKEENEYDRVGYPVFSPDSRHVAYPAVGGKVFMVVDGKTEQPYESVFRPVFSPDSMHMAYMAKANGKWFAVFDGKERNRYDNYWPNTFRFNPDGKDVGYIAESGGKWVAVIGGKEGRKHDLGPPVFDPGNPKKITGWKNEREKGTLVFSPDGRRAAYLAQAGKIVQMAFRNSGRVQEITFGTSEWFAVVDGKEGRKYDDIPGDSIVFSPDGRHVAYCARKKGKSFVVVDGKEGTPYDRVLLEDVTVGMLAHLQYKERRGRIVFDSPDSLHYLAVKDGGIHLVTVRLSTAPSGGHAPR